MSIWNGVFQQVIAILIMEQVLTCFQIVASVELIRVV